MAWRGAWRGAVWLSDRSHGYDVLGLPSEELVLAQTYDVDDSFQKSGDRRQSPFSRLSSKYPVWTLLRLDCDLCWRLWRPKKMEPEPQSQPWGSGPGRMMYGSNLARASPPLSIPLRPPDGVVINGT
ncbi:hypothetical protein BDW72DRAFT_30519 [Aspergillus terricola var. indicus]